MAPQSFLASAPMGAGYFTCRVSAPFAAVLVAKSQGLGKILPEIFAPGKP